MSDSELFKSEPKKIEIEVTEVTPEAVSKPPAKKEKVKRVLSDERKAALREQLKKGRETSMANRQKKGLAKKLAKKEETDAQDMILAESLLKRSKKDAPPSQTPPEPKAVKTVPKQVEKVSEGPSEIELLKQELAEMKKHMNKKVERSKTPPAPKPAPAPVAPPAQPKIAKMRRKKGVFN